MTGKHPVVRVLDPGGISYDDWNVAGAVAEHERLPGWRFCISLSLRDGRVLGLTIDPVSSEAFETGITVTKLLRVLPLEEIVSAIRSANAERLLAWSPKERVRRHEIDDEGRTISVRQVDVATSAAMRQTMREIAAPIRRNPRLRQRKQRLSDRQLAEEVRAYSRAVAAGFTVAQFVQEARVNRATFDDHRKEAIRRGLFTSAGQRGRSGGSLTTAGERALRDEE